MPSVIRGSDLFDTNTAIGFSTNHNAATGTITIPSGLEVGTRRLIRKIHPTQGTVTINCTGETFTRAGLASVELNADGDYWLLEKVTATRWELVDGWNTGENANGVWKRSADGTQICTQLNGVLSFESSHRLRYNWTFPVTFAGLPASSFLDNVTASPLSGKLDYATPKAGQSASTATLRLALIPNAPINFVSGDATLPITISSNGRWY